MTYEPYNEARRLSWPQEDINSHSTLQKIMVVRTFLDLLSFNFDHMKLCCDKQTFIDMCELLKLAQDEVEAKIGK